MATSRRREAWAHTTALLAQLCEIHRDKKKRSQPYRPEEFLPASLRGALARPPVIKGSIETAKCLFLPGYKAKRPKPS